MYRMGLFTRTIVHDLGNNVKGILHSFHENLAIARVFVFVCALFVIFRKTLDGRACRGYNWEKAVKDKNDIDKAP